MNVKEILTNYLKENGFDGLFNVYAECGCKTDDLAPCDCMNINDCESGYLKSATVDCEWNIGQRRIKRWMR